MIIPDKQLDDFINRWQNAYGETLERSDARMKATQLLELYMMMARHAERKAAESHKLSSDLEASE